MKPVHGNAARQQRRANVAMRTIIQHQLASSGGAGGAAAFADLTGDADDNASLVAYVAALLAGKQPLDADLTAIAAVATQVFGRSVLSVSDAGALRALAGLIIGTDVQAYDADLAAIAALLTTAFGRGFLDLADAAAARTKLGLGSAALAASGDFQPIDPDLTALAAVATQVFGRSVLSVSDAGALRALAGLIIGTDVQAYDADLAAIAAQANTAFGLALLAQPAPVHMAADAAARGAAIADYFASSLALDANSTYDIECHAHFLKTTAGTVLWTWLCSSAPVMLTSRYEATPITGYSGAAITGAPVQAQATSRGQASTAHAASGSLTTAVDHSFMFWLRIRTNAATTIQLRSTESAGTITPRAGSYMRATKTG